VTDTPQITKSSGNVFADLGFPNPDLELAKSDLAITVTEIIRKRKLSRARAAAVLQIEPSTVARVAIGDLEEISLECLVLLLNRLNVDVEIAISPNGSGKAAGHLTVAHEREAAPARS
jgi:predicted XRE-type DNA-binding protein